MVMSGADKAIYAYRNGNPIGQRPGGDRRTRSARRSCVLAARRCDRPHELSGTRPPGASLDVGDWSQPSFIPIAASTMNGLRFGSRSTLHSLLQNVALLLF